MAAALAALVIRPIGDTRRPRNEIVPPLRALLVPKLQLGHALVCEAPLRRRGRHPPRPFPMEAWGSRASKTTALPSWSLVTRDMALRNRQLPLQRLKDAPLGMRTPLTVSRVADPARSAPTTHVAAVYDRRTHQTRGHRHFPPQHSQPAPPPPPAMRAAVIDRRYR